MSESVPGNAIVAAVEASRHSQALENALLFSANPFARECMRGEVALCRKLLDQKVPCGTWPYTAVHLFIRNRNWHGVKETRELFQEYVDRSLIRLNEPLTDVRKVTFGYAEGMRPLEATLACGTEASFFAFLDAGADHRLVPGPVFAAPGKVEDVFDLIRVQPGVVLNAPGIAARLTEYLMQRQVRAHVGTSESVASPAPRRRRHFV